MKLDKGLKITLIILLIILISIISFAGIFVQKKGNMTNVIKDYQLGMDLAGSRIVSVAVNTGVETVYYDKDGKVVEEEVKGGSKKEIPINSKDILTPENYKKTKEIIEKRLSDYGMAEYLVRQDEKTGKITVQMPEDSDTDFGVQYIATIGKFTIVGENEEVLLDNSNVKQATAGYGGTETGTSVYLTIEFNKDSIEKLKEISKTYVESTDEKGNDTTKKISIQLDENELTSTSFKEEITNGILQITIGNSSTNTEVVNSYLQEARNLAILINNGELPIEYSLEQNRYVASDITKQDLSMIGLISLIVVLIGAVILGIIYKKNGILVGISGIGYIAVLLMLIRYTNVILTIEGLAGIAISVILNYIFAIRLLKTMKEEVDTKRAYNKTTMAMLWILIPAFVIGITMCFVNWMPIYSFGELIFWGILTILIYNTVLTRTLLICNTKNK